LAWAEIVGADVDTVDAAFCYVRSGRVVRPELPQRAELEKLLSTGTA
jgi:DNA helicase-2/ATP-dependent DNA helicase PcrA